MNGYLNYLVDNVSRRYRLVRLGWVLALAWMLMAVIGIALSANIERLQLSDWQRSLFAGLAVIMTIAMSWSVSRGCFRDTRWIAGQIEERFPSLKQRLITAVQLTNAHGFFEQSLIDETIRHAREHDWTRTVSNAKIFMAWLCQTLSLGIAIWGINRLWNLPLSSNSSTPLTLSALAAPKELQVEPGDIEVERGTDVVVTIRFPREVPEQAWLESTAATAATTPAPQRDSMKRNLKDPLFGGYLRNLQSDQSYRIDYQSGISPAYTIKVFDFPALVKSDAHIHSPAYANMSDRTIEDTRRVTVVDGAELTWTCTVNKPLSRAALVDDRGEVTPMENVQNHPLQYTVRFTMTESRKWRVKLIDLQDRTCKFEEELSAKVLMNKEPEIKLANASDLRVSPLQEFQIKATVQDDFGVQKSGLAIALGDEEQHEVEVESIVQKSGKVDITRLLDLESLQAKPDQLLSYYFWTEDLDRDGNPRRVDGEMFFAEVRPFEEIFRQGEAMSREQQRQQQQQQSQGGQQAEELAELQKQIMTATWNVLRREKQEMQSVDYVSDVQTILDSQRQALEKTEAMEKELKDEKSLEYLDQVRDAMSDAIKHLEYSMEPADLKQLRSAFQQERKANELLLKLRAREHQIVQSQQQSSSAQQRAGQRNRQEQIEQLKLKDDENRFEDEQQAETNEPSAQREARQVMNRLEELARRQKDVNEQVKNLENELREAKTEEKKKEVEEQLKRLRENQEDLLRDTDELLERMNQPENRQAMQEAREQTEQARSDLQRSAESLSKGETAQSRSAGTRAERQLEETREQLRKETSDQFEQTMRDLLRQAESLEQRQEKLTEGLMPDRTSQKPGNSSSNSNRKDNDEEVATSTLRPDGTDETTDEQKKEWQSQKRELTNLLDKVRETVTEAESSQPILAEQLYDTFRETKQKGLEQRMDQIQSLVDRGLEEPALRTAQEVSKGIQDLKNNIEEASAGVLSSEQESLRRALAELKRAENQLNEELARKDPQSGKARDDARRDPQEQGSAPGQRDQNQPTSPNGSPGQENQPRTSDQPSNKPREQDSESQGTEQQGSEQQGKGQQGANQQRGSNTGLGGLAEALGQSRGSRSGAAPLTGEEYGDWMDSLRDVEELVRDPALRAETARIREAARSMRVEYKRHGKEPQWPLVRQLVADPMEQLMEKVQSELLRLAAERNSLVPVDRDPVPSIYQTQLDRYYENLGTGQERGSHQ